MGFDATLNIKKGDQYFVIYDTTTSFYVTGYPNKEVLKKEIKETISSYTDEDNFDWEEDKTIIKGKIVKLKPIEKIIKYDIE